MKTKIICLIDKSGSMDHLQNDSIGGFNTFLKEQKEIEDVCFMDITLFDTEFKFLVSNTNINEIEGLNKKNYRPAGGTSLLDCIGYTIDKELDRLSESPDNRFDKTLFLIMTDGESNSDKNYTKDRIKLMIEEMEEHFKWNFIFIGANQDSFSAANGMGISAGKTMNWSADTEGINVAYSSISKVSTYYRTTSQDNYDNIFKESE
jgi:uncharacterized protein with von Willebrand factor type A (vWA) domain